MRVAIVTNAIFRTRPTPEYVGITDRQKRKYCERWGIAYVRRSVDTHPDLHPVWCKPSVLLAEFDRYEWVVWVDADAMPVGMEFDLRSYLSTVGERVVMQRDVVDWNNGVFAIPCTSTGRKWLEDVEAHCHDQMYQRGLREQQCMSDLFASRWGDYVVEPPLEIGWNSYLPIYGERGDRNIYKDGDWMLHIPGVRDDRRRAELLGRYAK